MVNCVLRRQREEQRTGGMTGSAHAAMDERRPDEGLLFHDEVDAAIFLPAHGVVLQTQGTVLAVARHIHLQLAHAQRFEVPLDREGAPFTQHQIVFRGADFIAATFQEHFGDMIVSQPFGIVLHRSEGIVA